MVFCCVPPWPRSYLTHPESFQRSQRNVQFLASLRDRIRSGEITCSVRLWQRPHVRVGGRYPLSPGHIVVTQLFEITLADVTPDLARRSGFVGVVDLLKVAKHGPGRRVFLIEFRYVAPDRNQGKMTTRTTARPRRA
jgi:hypothetical protein